MIACLSKFDHISDTLKELHWLPVEKRISFKINLICFKILNNLAPDYLVDLIHVYEPARYLRSSSDKWRLSLVIKPFRKIQLVVYHQCCDLIGCATSRLYVIAH